MPNKFNFRKPFQQSTAGLKTVVFIDYEYLYVSVRTNELHSFSLTGLCEEFKTMGKIMNIYVFGDFTKFADSREREKVRTVTSNIIDCGNGSQLIKKDFSDFIMLDKIYQEMLQSANLEQFVLVTGDGHFSSVSTCLRNYMDKVVGVYGFHGSLSSQLVECASWAKELCLNNIVGKEEEENQKEETQKLKSNLLNNLYRVEQKNKITSYTPTVNFTSKLYGGEVDKYKKALNELIRAGLIEYEFLSVSDKYGDSRRVLKVNWDKVSASEFKMAVGL